VESQARSNERLRVALAAAGLTTAQLARHAGVDMKTAERWINTSRVPHSRHRLATARLLATEETYLWPSLIDDIRLKTASDSELLTVYPNRGSVPGDVWVSLVDRAHDGIDILVYAGLFLWDTYPELPSILAEKARSGITTRLLLGDPSSDAVLSRGSEEGIGDAIAARIRISLTYLSPLVSIPGAELRLHSTPLYNSLYRFDNDLLVNTHAFGAPAAQSPVLHLRRVSGGRLFSHYLSSFDRVWTVAANWTTTKTHNGTTRLLQRL
jgi:transcriptional regulator with XRE-family HTH domain